jgi:hypothetical protein
MKLLGLEFPPASCYAILPESKYPQHRFQTPSVCVPPIMSETKFHTHREPPEKLYFLIF